MNRCTKCGTEFEGNFCPECGTSATEEIICPKCGKTLKAGAKFCVWCGYSFEGAPIPRKSEGGKARSSAFIEKLYGILKAVPSAGFALFSVLLFLFYIAPVAVVPIFGESYGSAYTIMIEAPDLLGDAIALLVFAGLSLICASALLAVKLTDYRFKSFNAFGKQITLSEALEYSSFVFYFIFFLLGCIVCGRVSALGGELGLMTVGACPVLVLVFSILFALAGAGALVARYFLKKSFPQFAQSEEERIGAQFQAYEERASARFQAYKAKIEQLVNAGAPAEPQKVEKPQAPLKAKKIVNGKIRAIFFAFFFVAMASAVLTVAVIAFDKDDFWLNAYFLSGAGPFTVAVAIISAFIRVKKVNSQKIYKKGFLTFTSVISIATILGFSIYPAYEGIAMIAEYLDKGSIEYINEKEVICYFAVVGFMVLFGLVSFFLSLAGILKIRKIQKDEEVFGELNGQLEAYDNGKAEYSSYLKQRSDYKKQCKKYSRVVKKYEKMTATDAV